MEVTSDQVFHLIHTQLIDMPVIYIKTLDGLDLLDKQVSGLSPKLQINIFVLGKHMCIAILNVYRKLYCRIMSQYQRPC